MGKHVQDQVALSGHFQRKAFLLSGWSEPGCIGPSTYFSEIQGLAGFNIHVLGVPVVAQWLTDPTRKHGVEGSVPALAQWVDDPALL